MKCSKCGFHSKVLINVDANQILPYISGIDLVLLVGQKVLNITIILLFCDISKVCTT